MGKVLLLLAIALSKVSNTCKECKKKQCRIPYLDQNWLRATKKLNYFAEINIYIV